MVTTSDKMVTGSVFWGITTVWGDYTDGLTMVLIYRYRLVRHAGFISAPHPIGCHKE
jgi:hypothetical protein